MKLLGIDIGTTGVRAAVFDLRGTLSADASLACPHSTPRSGWAEADPDAWWNAIQRVLAEIGKTQSLVGIAGVAVVGQAPTAVLVDDEGNAVRPAVLWLDTRAEAEATELGTQAYYLGPKLLWLSRHEPEALASTRHILQSHAFIGYRLTGEVATDPSTAALCEPLFDLGARVWREEACSRVGVRISQLPKILRASEILGTVSQTAAALTGLRAGTPVVAGGGDFAAATLGAGVLEEGEACLMLGTAGNLLIPLRSPGRDSRLINAHHVGADSWLSLGGTLSGGAQEWLRRALVSGFGAVEERSASGLASFEELDAEASRVAPGSEGLLLMPYLQGERTPIWDVNARGAYIGLGLQHGRGHLWRALLEGIALSFVDCQSVVEESGTRLREVIAANGGGKSALFRQILCDALGVPLVYSPKAGGTVAGAAILVGLGVGALAGPDAARGWRGEVVRHVPNAESALRYRELARIRGEAYRALRPVFADLTRARTS